ncbi:EGCase [Oopsacas minuta]|uniref:EGCase n=1 Tax=Oopsacas minuta TaxID=111878 RepID=A0AAV7KML0_9METZ|nr:EGCase [Oopsacas minuta]
MNQEIYILFFLTLGISLAATLQNLGSISVNPETKRLIDKFGREVYFHGVNVVYKVPPYVPRTDSFNPIHSFVEKDMKILSGLGLNVIRLGLMWPGAEPQKGQFNETYYEAIRSIVDKAYKYNIYTILDMHQDVLSEKFCGEGAPSWAINTGNASKFPFPFSFSSMEQIPNKTNCLEHLWAEYYATTAAGAAFQNIYDNTDGILDSLAGFWKKTASEFKDHKSVIGYELINEPWLGDLYTKPWLVDPGEADLRNLAPLYQKLSSAIREVDQNHVIMFEPVTWADLGTGFKEVPGGDLYRNRSVLSYHYYVPPDMPFVKEQFEVRMADLEKLKCGGFLTEYAICGNGADLIEKVLNACDEYKQSWTGWMYKLYGNITGDCSGLFDPETGEVNQKISDILSRSYPLVVAGEVESISFNSKDSEFNLVYRTRQHIPDTTTQIYVNTNRHYSGNPKVIVATDIKYTVVRNVDIITITHESADDQVINVNITPP